MITKAAGFNWNEMVISSNDPLTTYQYYLSEYLDMKFEREMMGRKNWEEASSEEQIQKWKKLKKLADKLQKRIEEDYE